MGELAKNYQSKSQAYKLFLKNLLGQSMEEDGDLRDHLNNLGEKFKDEEKVYSSLGVYTQEI